MKEETLKTLIDNGAEKIRLLLHEASTKMLESMREKLMEDDVQEKESKPVFRVSIPVVFDMSSEPGVEASIKFGVTYKRTATAGLQDVPGQRSLFDEDPNP